MNLFRAIALVDQGYVTGLPCSECDGGLLMHKDMITLCTECSYVSEVDPLESDDNKREDSDEIPY
jgi:hypothetical protein